MFYFTVKVKPLFETFFIICISLLFILLSYHIWPISQALIVVDFIEFLEEQYQNKLTEGQYLLYFQ